MNIKDHEFIGFGIEAFDYSDIILCWIRLLKIDVDHLFSVLYYNTPMIEFKKIISCGSLDFIRNNNEFEFRGGRG